MTTRVLPQPTASRIAGCLQDLAASAARSREELIDNQPLYVWYEDVSAAIRRLHLMLGDLDPDHIS